MEIKKIVEGMTAPQVAEVIDSNFKGLNEEKANKVETDAKLSELGQNQWGIRLVGNDDALVTAYLHLIAGHQYKVFMVNPNWNFDVPGRSKLMVGRRNLQGGLVNLIDIPSTGIIPADFTINAVESLNDNRYSITIRANKGVEVFAYVEDVTLLKSKIAYISSETNPYVGTEITIPKLQMVNPGEAFKTIDVNQTYDMTSAIVCALVIDSSNTISTKSMSLVTGNEQILMVRLNGSVNTYIGGLLYNDYNEWMKTETGKKVSQLGSKIGLVSVAKDNDTTLMKTSFDGDYLRLTAVGETGYSLTEIFEDHNFLGVKGFDDGSYAPMTNPYGSVEIDDEVYDTPGYSIKYTAAESSQLKSPIPSYSGTTKYVACRVRVDEYTQGAIGFLRTNSNLLLQRKTNGWETLSTVHNSLQAYYFLGTTQSPDMVAWIDSPVVIDLAMFSEVPSKEKMDELYEAYINMKKNSTGETTIVIEAKKGITVTDNECIQAFVDKMNEYARRIGMSNTNFVNSSGVYDENHYSCAKDITKMCLACTAYDKLMTYWGQTSYAVKVLGSNERTISGVSAYKGDSMSSVGNYYHIFGGKSGSWTLNGFQNKNLTLAVRSKIDDAWLIGCIMKSSASDRGIPFKELMDWLESYRTNPDVPTPTLQCEYASAFVVPSHNPMAYNDVDLEMVGKNSTTQFLPASTTKLMTAMILLDYMEMDSYMTIKQSDITSGSGDTFYDGDIIQVKDAVLALLLPSSNTLAKTIARIVGREILRKSVVL